MSLQDGGICWNVWVSIDKGFPAFLLNRQAKLQVEGFPSMLKLLIKVAYFYLSRHAFTIRDPWHTKGAFAKSVWKHAVTLVMQKLHTPPLRLSKNKIKLLSHRHESSGWVN